MAQYKKYNKYIFSGIDWLGDVPELWIKRKLTWIFGVIGSGTTPTTSNADYYDGDIPWLITGDLNDGIINVTSKTVTDLALAEFSALKLFPENSLVMAMYGATIGKLGLTKIKTTTNQACCVMANPINADLLYLFFWLLGNRKEIINLSQGGGQPNISQSIIRSLRLYCPPIEEQTMIAKFLDKKTSEIDSLIADKEKLIKLLEEQRLAIITEAVTKGLNPNVKMKDSGIKWIGEIPEHWLIIKIKYLTKIDYGLGQPPKLSEMGIPILRATNISKGKITKKDMIYAQLEDLPLERVPLLTEGEILVVRSGAYTGDSAIVTEEYSGSSPGYDLRVRATKVDSRYLAFCLLSTTVLQNQIYLEKLRAAQPHLNAEDLGRCFICLPSTLYEQEQISNSLNEKMMEFDFLIEKIQTQINKLNDYRQSLIFEAVTGKIDVSDIAVDEAVTV